LAVETTATFQAKKEERGPVQLEVRIVVRTRAVRAGHAARAKQLTDAHTRRLVDACRTQIGDRVDRPIDWI
jgi:hypothetical protein